MQTNLNTERLSLATVTTEDDAFMLELLNSKGWIEFIGDRHVHSRKAAVTFIEKVNKTRNITYWVVKLKTDNIPAGIISFLKRDYLEYFDIGFAFLPQYTGKGYAYEATKAILEMLKQYPEHTIILASTMPENQKSIGLLSKLGFRFDKEIEVGQEILRISIHDAAIG